MPTLLIVAWRPTPILGEKKKLILFAGAKISRKQVAKHWIVLDAGVESIN
jgi:hypothetical protein